MNNNIAIIWDLGGVVVDVNEKLLPFDYYSISQDWIDFESGKLSESKFLEKYPLFISSINVLFTPNNFVINLIKSLPPKCQYYFSNTNPIHFNWLKENYNILNTNNRFLSYEIGLRKPDEEVYSYVESHIPNTQIFFIEDREKNLVVPKNMGWNTFLYSNNNNNNKELEEFISNVL